LSLEFRLKQTIGEIEEAIQAEKEDRATANEYANGRIDELEAELEKTHMEIAELTRLLRENGIK